MLLLAVDTSSAATAVAVAGADVAVERTAVDPRRHAEVLAPLMDEALRAAGATRGDLSAAAVGLGPGPYTGLRVGLVTVAAMADALAVPAYGLGSLDVLAAGHRGPGRLAVVTDARRREVYWALYDEQGARVRGPHVDYPQVVADLLRTVGPAGVRVAGAGALVHRDAFAGFDVADDAPYPSALALARLVMPRAAAGEPGDALTPLYLRRPDAVPPGPRKLVTPA